MSKAFKCDLCRTCFDPADMTMDEWFTHIEGMKFRSRKDYLNNTISNNNWYIDFHLCPVCTEKILKIKQGEEIENDISMRNDADQIINEIGSYGVSDLYRLAAAFEREIGRRVRNSIQYDGSCVFEGPGEAPQRKKRAEKDGE